MGTMTIDGRKVEFTDEKNVLTVHQEMPVSISPHCAIIQRFPHLVPVVSVQLRMTEARHLLPVPSSRETEWLFIPIPAVLRNIVN